MQWELHIESVEKKIGIILLTGNYTKPFAQELWRRKRPKNLYFKLQEDRKSSSSPSTWKSNRSFFEISRKVKSDKGQANITEIDWKNAIFLIYTLKTPKSRK